MDQQKLKNLRLIFLILIILAVISAFVVPYIFLDSINSFKGAFLYWFLFAVFVIFLTIKITSYWGND